MAEITVVQLRDHCRADSDDDDLLAIYLEAAKAACARAANRNLYWTEADLTAAQELAVANMAQASEAYLADRITNADSLYALALGERKWQDAKNEFSNTVNGIVIEGDIVEAILLSAGHYWRNREEVAASNGAQAVQLPQTSEVIMYRHMYVGPPL